MKIEFDVQQIVVLTGSGTDKILITTALPEACWPYAPSGCNVEIHAAKGTGVAYLKKHFGVDPDEVVNTRVEGSSY